MKQILYKLFEHQYLGRDEARTILQNIAQGKYNDVQVASLITVFLTVSYTHLDVYKRQIVSCPMFSSCKRVVSPSERKNSSV